MEADIDSDVDAATIEKTGAKVIQLHTGGMCHLDAGMTKQGLDGLGVDDVDLAILENVEGIVPVLKGSLEAMNAIRENTEPIPQIYELLQTIKRDGLKAI